MGGLQRGGQRLQRSRRLLAPPTALPVRRRTRKVLAEMAARGIQPAPGGSAATLGMHASAAGGPLGLPHVPVAPEQPAPDSSAVGVGGQEEQEAAAAAAGAGGAAGPSPQDVQAANEARDRGNTCFTKRQYEQARAARAGARGHACGQSGACGCARQRRRPLLLLHAMPRDPCWPRPHNSSNRRAPTRPPTCPGRRRWATTDAPPSWTPPPSSVGPTWRPRCCSCAAGTRQWTPATRCVGGEGGAEAREHRLGGPRSGPPPL